MFPHTLLTRALLILLVKLLSIHLVLFSDSLIYCQFVNSVNEMKHTNHLRTDAEKLHRLRDPVYLLVQDGEIIECVDIYKQPAFSHPHLKNHTIQMKPSSYPGGLKAGDYPIEHSQNWHKYGKCPSGTIPIPRTQSYGHKKGIPFVPNRTGLNISDQVLDPTHEYAQVSLTGDKLYGATAGIGLWNPSTFDGESSFSQIWILSGGGENLNTIETGWLVKSGEKNTKLFVYWTKDGYENTGCYNLECPGFVQINQRIALGGNLAPVSVYNGVQHQLKISIFKDKQAGNWWLQVQDQPVGYWPDSIFTSMADGATSISWGGEIINESSEGHHTSTQMGSGHFPVEGPGKASSFRNVGYMGINDEGNYRDPPQLTSFISKPACYDLHIAQKEVTDGVHFFYGGPGYSDKCA